MNIKVSGITSVKQLQQLDGLDVDFAGMIFYEKSPRFAGSISKKELRDLDLDIKKVGVFVNAEYDEIMKIAEGYSLDMVQLHGEESPYLCEQVSNELEVIKTFRIDDTSDKSIDYMVMEYDEVCDYYLFDGINNNTTAIADVKFNWDKIAESKILKPFFLSGGIGPQDSRLVKEFKHPDFYGIDLTNLFEKEPGVKDMSLLLQFMHGLKHSV